MNISLVWCACSLDKIWPKRNGTAVRRKKKNQVSKSGCPLEPQNSTELPVRMLPKADQNLHHLPFEWRVWMRRWMEKNLAADILTN